MAGINASAALLKAAPFALARHASHGAKAANTSNETICAFSTVTALGLGPKLWWSHRLHMQNWRQRSFSSHAKGGGRQRRMPHACAMTAAYLHLRTCHMSANEPVQHGQNYRCLTCDWMKHIVNASAWLGLLLCSWATMPQWFQHPVAQRITSF